METADPIDQRFFLEAIAGEGGMGTVFRARDAHTGATVALKAMRTDAKSEVSRFLHEARLLAELDHPVIQIGPASAISQQYEDGQPVGPVKPGDFRR